MPYIFLPKEFSLLAIITLTFLTLPFSVSAASSSSTESGTPWYSEAWEYFEDNGTLDQVSTEILQPDENITRAEFAALIFETLNMEAAHEKNSPFTDVAQNDPYFPAIITLTNHNIIQGYNDGTFQPDATLTRAQMAVILSNAYKVKANSSEPLLFTDLDPHHWAYEDIRRLYETAIIKGHSPSTFAPNQLLTWAQAVQGIYGAEQFYEATVVGNVSKVSEEIHLTDVEALNQDGRYLEVTFSEPLDSLHKSQIHIFDTSTLDIHGVQAVELIENGNKAIVTLYEGAGLDTLTDYTIEFTANEYVSAFPFYREEYLKISNVKITGVDVKNREITLTKSNDQKMTLEVPSTIEMDFVDAYNREATVWHNREGEVTLYEITNPNKKMKKKKRFIKQYDLNVFLLVHSIDDGVASGINGEIDLERFNVYVKSHKMIDQEEIKPGDFLLFNYKDKVMEVGTNIITGNVDAVYDSGINVAGEVYDYNGYALDEDNDLEKFDVDIAEDLENKEITLYLNIDDEIVFVR